MLNTIQAGRAAAAIAVAAFHLSIGMGKPQYGDNAVFEAFTRFGNLGVDFFFVLSGFIILHAHEKDIGRPERVARYFRNRVIRVFPIYLLYSAIFVGLVLIGVGDVVLPSSIVDWVSIVSLVRLSDTDAPIRAAWTLFHEVGFYAAFGVIIVWPRLGLAVFAAWMAVCLVKLNYPSDLERTSWATYTAAWNLNFALGMIAYKLHRTLRFGWLFLVVGAAVSGAAVALAYQGWPYYQLLFAVGAGLLLSGLATTERLGQLSVPAWTALIGNASYTIYLTHAPHRGPCSENLHQTANRHSATARFRWHVGWDSRGGRCYVPCGRKAFAGDCPPHLVWRVGLGGNTLTDAPRRAALVSRLGPISAFAEMAA